jgi:hypothetical protein
MFFEGETHDTSASEPSVTEYRDVASPTYGEAVAVALGVLVLATADFELGAAAGWVGVAAHPESNSPTAAATKNKVCFMRSA